MVRPGVPCVQVESWGRTTGGELVHRAVIDNGRGLRLAVLSLGGVVQHLEVPDRHGERANVVLGFDELAPYELESPYFGAVVGRCANRIRDGRFSLDGVVHQTAVNDPYGTVHGGVRGFDRRLWELEALRTPRAGVRLTRVSPDGEEGFPGALSVAVEYTVDADRDVLRVDWTATTDAPTHVNLTTHCYFDLAGEGSGTALGQVLEVASDDYLPLDSTLLPMGPPSPVWGTPFDFRAPRVIGERIRDDDVQLALCQGYDHDFVLSGTAQARLDGSVQAFDQHGEVCFAARLHDPGSGRTLEVWTTEPGLDLYTANLLDGKLRGTSGRAYRQGDGVCLLPEHFADSPNHPEYPSTVLRPGEVHRSTTEYRFSAGPPAG